VIPQRGGEPRAVAAARNAFIAVLLPQQARVPAERGRHGDARATLGHTNVHAFDGGVEAWENAGRGVEPLVTAATARPRRAPVPHDVPVPERGAPRTRRRMNASPRETSASPPSNASSA
jgi:hypothetical protein